MKGASPLPGQRTGRRGRAVTYRVLRWLVSLRGSSHAIAGGLAIGVFVAFTPTVGFQMLLAASLATLTGANRPAAILPVWITNPATIVPIFLFAYRTGSLLSPGPHPSEVRVLLTGAVRQIREHGLLELTDQFGELVKLGIDVFVPLLIGGTLLGLAAAVPVYVASLQMIQSYRKQRRRRKKTVACV